MALKKDEIKSKAKAHVEDSGLRQMSGELQPLLIRLDSAQKEWLKKHFARKGLALSAGIRMVLSEYIEENS